MGWSEERVTLLKKLWTDGLSAAQIAKQLGGGVTRNAVIGKVHRLGLAGRATPSRPAKPRPRIARPRPAAQPSAPALARAKLQPQAPVVQLDPFRFDDGSVASVLTLTDRMCKWPIGDPGEDGFAFCGRASCNGSSYCAEHSAHAFQPQQRRQRKERDPREEVLRTFRLAG